MLGQGVADLLFNGVAHWARAEFGMKPFADEKGQNGFIQFECVTARGEKFNFTR